MAESEANVVTEEIGVGVLSGGGGSSGFDVGQYLLSSTQPVESSGDTLTAETNIVSSGSPVMLSDDIQVKSVRVSNEVKKMDVSGVPSGGPSSADLNAVSAVLKDVENTCSDVDEIVTRTGLSKEVVIYCIEWLVSQGLVARDASRYCGLSSVKRMCEQLKGCKNCLSNASP